MQKEIFEQPRAVADTLEGVARIDAGAVRRGGGRRFRRRRRRADPRLRHELLLQPCRQALDRVPRRRFPARWRSRASTAIATACPMPTALVVVVSQSGETADTLAALKHAKALGHRHTLAICNVATSAMVRQTALAYLTRAGIEIGVASTKAFTTQLVALFLLTLALAQAARPARRRRRGALAQGPAPPAGGAAGRARARAADHRLGGDVREEGERALPRPRPALPDRARGRAQAEGDLVHPRRGVSGGRAQARAAGAGRRDHAGGRDRARTTRCWRSSSRNLQEVRARGGELYVVADLDSHIAAEPRACTSSACPSTPGCSRRSCTWCRCSSSPTTPRCMRGTDVDKPRNLAKSVTVE